MQRKGSGQVVDFRFAARWQQYFYHIHTAGYFFAKASQPELSHAPQQLAFVFIYPAGRTPGACVQGTFHLRKDQQVALAAHDINFAAGSHAETAAQYLVSLSPQPRGRHQLAVFAEVSAFRPRVVSPGAVPVVQQAQTCGDGVS